MANFRSNRIRSQSEEVEGASAIEVKRDQEKEARNESGTSTSSQEDRGDNVCPEQNNSLLDSSEEDTADGASGADVEEDEEHGIEAVEDGEDEELDEDDELESPTMDSTVTYLEDMLDTMAESATTLAETMHTLQTTGAEPRVELRC